MKRRFFVIFRESEGKSPWESSKWEKNPKSNRMSTRSKARATSSMAQNEENPISKKRGKQ